MNVSPSCTLAARITRTAHCCSRLPALLGMCLIAVTGTVQAVDLDKEISIEVAAGSPLDEALTRWSRLADVQVMGSTETAAHLKAEAVHGRLSAGVALSQLLQGSGLRYQVVRDSVVINRVDSDPTATKPGSGEAPSVPREGASSPGNDASRAPGSDGPGTHDPKFEEVVIDGHLRNADPDTLVITVDRQSIQQSGYQSTGDLVHHQPQNFGGGSNANVIGAGGRQNIGSPSGAYTANIRGLGSESTLTLLDGSRLAPSAGSSAVDLNQIPIAAIERVDIIPNGATAIYGSDAVAGVVNIILRNDYRGIEASTAVGGATEGGGDLWQYNFVGGTDWPGGHGLGCFHIAQQAEVDSQQRSYVAASLYGTSLVPETRNISALATVEQQLTQATQAAVKALFTTRSDRQTENLSSQLPGLVGAESSRVKQYALIASADSDLPRGWVMRVSAEVASDDVVAPDSLTLYGNLYSDGGATFNNRLRSVEVDLDGMLWRLRGALGGGFRDESFTFVDLQDDTFRIGRKRGVRFAFVEAELPLMGTADEKANAPSLSLRLSGRLDSYTDFGSSANPKIALIYTPLRGLQLRAAWGTSLRAPTLLQEYDAPQATLESVTDPSAPGGKAIILQRFGGNAGLRPEKSFTASIDVKLIPPSLTGLSMDIGYYYIDYRERIGIPTPDTGSPLSDPNIAPFVARDPSAAELAPIIEQSVFSNRTGAPYDPHTVAALVDDRYQNIARQRASGIDFLSRYERNTRIGRLDLSLNVAWLDLREHISRDSPVQTLSGTVFYPPRFRARGGLAWDHVEYTAATFLNYVGPSRDVDSTPPFRVTSWTTVDVQIGHTGQSEGFWRGVRVTLTAQNLFDRRPPFIHADPTALPGINFDSTNTSPVGCFFLLEVGKTW